MAGGLRKVGKPSLDRFARADRVMQAAGAGGEGHPYVATSPALAHEPLPPPAMTVKKTVNLTTRSLDDLRYADMVLMRNGRKAKETELLRAAIEFFARQPDAVIVEAFDTVEKLQTGPRRLGGRTP
jgi:hypothetical protein